MVGIPGLSFQLSATQQSFLVDHVDGCRPIGGHSDDATRKSLLGMGLLIYDQPLDMTSRPKGTWLTQKGRETLGYVLAFYADQLIRVQNARDDGLRALLPRGYDGRSYGESHEGWAKRQASLGSITNDALTSLPTRKEPGHATDENAR